MKSIFLVLIFSHLCFYACSKFSLNNDKIQASSDGAYVIETDLSDIELLSYGKEVVYRFKTVPNMLAVKSVALGKNSHNYFFENSIYKIPEENQKKRDSFNLTTLNPTTINGCYNAFCEAKFDKAIASIQAKNTSLAPIKIAIIDSGVVPSTFLIKNNLLNSLNLTKDNDINNWASHATYISSLFSGTIEQNVVQNIYAKNAKIVSIKITFSDDIDATENKNFGSMQLAVAIDTAVSLGAKIVNLSLSYDVKPDANIEVAEKIVMSQAAKNGVIFVISAGNEALDIENNPVYPASYDLNNIITVASHSASLQMASSSNYGYGVDLSAQANLIELNNKYGDLDVVSGTSFASPLVAAAISLYLGLFPNASINTILHDLFQSSNASYINNKKNNITRYGRLDAKAFLDLGAVSNR